MYVCNDVCGLTNESLQITAVVAVALYGNPRHNANQKFNVGTGSATDGVCTYLTYLTSVDFTRSIDLPGVVPIFLAFHFADSSNRSWLDQLITSLLCRPGLTDCRTIARGGTLLVMPGRTAERTLVISPVAMRPPRPDGSGRNLVSRLRVLS